MKRWMQLGAGLGGAVLGGIGTAVAAGTVRWNRATAQAIAQMDAHSLERQPAVFAVEQLAALPDPVARYLQFALTPGQPLIRRTRVEHRGTFRIGGLDAPWKPFSSVQRFTVKPAGFVWDATIRLAPLVYVRVRDSYLNGVGRMHGTLATLVTVVDAHGRSELDSATLQRYLAEAVWLPTALLPSQGVAWQAIDDSTALATLDDTHSAVTLQFHFNQKGEITRTYTQSRARDVAGQGVPTPWEGLHWNYAPVNGMMVPMDGEVAWLLPEGRLTYWRATIQRIEYDFDQAH